MLRSLTPPPHHLPPHHYLLSLSVSSGKLGFDSWWALIVVVAVAVVAVAVDAAA